MPVLSGLLYECRLHSRRVEDNTPYLLGSGYADLELTRPASTKDPAQVGLVVLNAPRGTAGVQHGKDPRPTNVLAPAC